MKPIIRYTIGQVSASGWHVLSESIRLIKKIYPEFDVFVCHNGMTSQEMEKLKSFEVELLRQDDLKPCFSHREESDVRNFYWKLIPERIRIESHELWMDNDIIITGRIGKIDDWLTKSTGLISTGFNPDYGRFYERIYGRFCENMKDFSKNYCAGFFGLPPMFDASSKIKELADGKPLKGFDEQGLVVNMITEMEDFIALEQYEMVLLSEYWKPKIIRGFPNGLHFARVNRFENHHSWKAYKFSINP